MAMRFNNQTEAKAWLQQTKGNKLERSKLDDNQKWSFMQAKHAADMIIGEYENEEMDEDIQVKLLHGDRQNLILDIYNKMQTSTFGYGFVGWGSNISKRHGYATKNFVLGAIDYFCEEAGY